MARISYSREDGSTTNVDVADGKSVMQAAVEEGIGEIVAECGGNLMCATCHVYVPDQEAFDVPPASDDESEMLACVVSPLKPSSRLSCQLKVSDELDGLTVWLPPEQV